MRQCRPVDHELQNKSKFALLTINNVYADLPPAKFQLSDGTWVMPGVPVPDLGVWKEWIGSIRMERLSGANLVLFVEEPSDNPEILNALFNGLKQAGQDRLHQFVRSLEALILPDIGKTEKQFAYRCQTFARAGDDTRTLLLEAFDMRSDTEHLSPWEEAVQKYPADQREDVCWHRTRQIEHLACDAYSRLLRDAALRAHFRTEAAIATFWKLPDDQRRTLWGKPLDITKEPLVQNYDRWERAIL